MANPYLQLFKGDWKRDLSTCSLAARELWLEMMFLMDEAEPRGQLTRAGKPLTDKAVATFAGISLREYQKLLAELEENGILSRTSEGIIYNRRMVREGQDRKAAAGRKKKQREKDAVTGDVTDDVTPVSHGQQTALREIYSKLSKSLSKGTDSSNSNLLTYTEQFNKYWIEYPRKLGKTDAKRYFLKSVKSAKDLEEFDLALDTALRLFRSREQEFVPYGSTFFHTWRDYLPQDDHKTDPKGAADAQKSAPQTPSEIVFRDVEIFTAARGRRPTNGSGRAAWDEAFTAEFGFTPEEYNAAIDQTGTPPPRRRGLVSGR
jgi:hypothetical protein